MNATTLTDLTRYDEKYQTWARLEQGKYNQKVVTLDGKLLCSFDSSEKAARMVEITNKFIQATFLAINNS